MADKEETLNPITLNQDAFDQQLLDFTNESMEALVKVKTPLIEQSPVEELVAV